MKFSWTSICAAMLFVAGWAPQMGQACVTVYLDYGVNEAQNKLEAWATVDECSASMGGGPYFEHSYQASVYINSPTQNWASDFDSTAWIPYGGGSADAFASISYEQDPGIFDIDLWVKIYCTAINLLLHLYEDVPFEIYHIEIDEAF